MHRPSINDEAPPAAGTEARPKAENENGTPRSYVPFEEEFNRLGSVVPFPLSPEAGQAAMFALALHGAGRASDRVRFLQKPEPGLGPNDGLRGEVFELACAGPWSGGAGAPGHPRLSRHLCWRSFISMGGLRPYQKKPIYELRRIQEIHADLDFYNLPAWIGAAPEMVRGAVLETLAQAGIARPGLVVSQDEACRPPGCSRPGSIPKPLVKAVTAMRALVQILKAFGAERRRPMSAAPEASWHDQYKERRSGPAPELRAGPSSGFRRALPLNPMPRKSRRWSARRRSQSLRHRLL